MESDTSRISTRLETQSFRNNWFLGDLSDHLPSTTLPTQVDISRLFFHSKQFLLYLKNSRQLNDDEKDMIYETLTHETIEIWRKSSIPCISKEEVKTYVKRAISKIEYIVTHRRSRKENDSEWISENLKSCDILLDIAKCKCFKSVKSLEDPSFDPNICKCSESDGKISTQKSKGEFSDLEFYIDQKSSRKFIIGWSKDVKDFKKKKKKIIQKEKLAKQRIREFSDSIIVNPFELDLSDDDFGKSVTLETFENDDAFEPSIEPSPGPSQNTRNRFEFKETIETARRYDLSDYSIAAFMNSHTNDMSEIVGFENPE